ncbi:MAG: helix-turn-helix domain-containing protein [Roseburia sp.]|nr:helix-turn-helix domain-containing protein [Roseburia sp.]
MKQQALGKRIREERLKLNLTQEKLAEDVNLSTAYIGQIERGERSLTLENLTAVANRLSVTIDYLLSDSIVPDSDGQYRLWRQLMDGRTEEQKALAVSMIKLLFGYLDENSQSTP